MLRAKFHTLPAETHSNAGQSFPVFDILNLGAAGRGHGAVPNGQGDGQTAPRGPRKGLPGRLPPTSTLALVTKRQNAEFRPIWANLHPRGSNERHNSAGNAPFHPKFAGKGPLRVPCQAQKTERG